MSGHALSETFPADIPKKDLDELFPLVREKAIKAKSYEFALVLGGTVSAGAYTAGVLDYICEALDAWTRAKHDHSPNAPQHDAILSTVVGSSGGAINGAILTRVASFAFPHGPVKGNPFYDVWVDGVDLSDLLTPDAVNVGLKSLFNTTKFASIAEALIKRTGPTLGSDGKTPHTRGYLANPLRLFMMVANVTGIPYRIKFRGETELGHDLVAHVDHVRFGLTVPGGADNEPGNRPDEFPLSFASPSNWDLVRDSALATSAFPAAFPSRPLKRALEILGYRVAVVPAEDQKNAEIAQLVPQWDALLEDGTTPGFVRTVNVDAGTVNNEPLDIGRAQLAGYHGRNLRKGDEAIRGVVLVDPFSDPATISPFDPPGFLDILGPLVSTLVYQARFKPEDVALGLDYDTYSRFLVAPKGPAGGVEVSGSKAIAAGGLGGFLGFVDKSMLDYDFRLGRLNAHNFLLNEFVLSENHDIFKGPAWSTTQRDLYGTKENNPRTKIDENFLPIIPLMPTLKDHPPMLPAWPRRSGVPENLPDQVEKRLNSIYSALKFDLQAKKKWPGGFAAFAINQAWSLFLRGTLRDKFVGTIAQALNDQNLLPVLVQKWPLTPEGKALAEAARVEWLAAKAKSSVLTKDATNWILTTKWT